MSNSRIERLLLLALLSACSGRVSDRTVMERPSDGGSGNAAGSLGVSTGVGGDGPLSHGGLAGTSSGGFAANGGTAGGPEQPPGCAELPYPAPLLPLSSWEYRRSVVALTATPVSVSLPPDEPAYTGPFTFGMSLQSAAVAKLFDEAEKQATKARGKLLPCDPAQGVDATCAAALVDNFVGGAYRRPLSDAERARYVGLFKLGSGQGDIDSGIELVVNAALMSPLFLFKTSFGKGKTGSSASPLVPFEVASRLSYFLTGAPPDAELWKVAANGTLLKDDVLAVQARRLEKSPLFGEAAQHFHAQWLDLESLPSLSSAQLSPELLASMRKETDLFVADVFLGKRSFDDLLRSSSGFVDDLLAPRYGVPAPPTAFAKVQLDGTRNFGLLTRASTLTRFDNPTQRGLFVRQRLLCSQVPPPPPNVDTHVTISPNQTRREAWLQHRTNPVCAGCHQLMDPIGFGFENFDEFGEYRVVDNGLPVDSSGEVSGGTDIDGPFADLGELSARLVPSKQVGTCLTRTWLSYALQRPLEDGDACAVDQAYESFARSKLDLGELMVAVALSAPFRWRDAYDLPEIPAPPGAMGAFAPLAARRKTLLDFVVTEAEWLRQKAPEPDRPVVDLYLTSIRELEQQLTAVGPGPQPAP